MLKPSEKTGSTDRNSINQFYVLPASSGIFENKHKKCAYAFSNSLATGYPRN